MGLPEILGASFVGDPWDTLGSGCVFGHCLVGQGDAGRGEIVGEAADFDCCGRWGVLLRRGCVDELRQLLRCGGDLCLGLVFVKAEDGASFLGEVDDVHQGFAGVRAFDPGVAVIHQSQTAWWLQAG